MKRAVIVICLVVVSCAPALGRNGGSPPAGSASPGQETASPTATPAPTPPPVVLVGAGDIASCALNGDELTARLLDQIPGIVFTAGDNAYELATAADFANCYAPTWGRHRARTRPATGTHEYLTPQARPYFEYFGAAAGDPATGYYSYDAGAWHVIVLNSNCAQVGGCGPGSPQERWLRADLGQHPRKCVLAIWHQPLFSSGDTHGSNAITKPLWQALYEAGADVVVVGHDHHYERFAPQDAEGRLDPARGIREFVVGTGGASLRGLRQRLPNSEVAGTGTWGVLELTLSAESYSWRFVPVAGGRFTDSGTATCH
jgi:hypothetical protein